MKKNCYEVFHQCIKIQNKGFEDVVNISKINSKPYGDLVGQAFWQFNEDLINNQDSQSYWTIEQPAPEYYNENDLEDTEIRHKICQFQTCAQKITRWWKHARNKFRKLKAKGNLQCGLYMYQRLCKVWWA